MANTVNGAYNHLLYAEDVARVITPSPMILDVPTFNSYENWGLRGELISLTSTPISIIIVTTK